MKWKTCNQFQQYFTTSSCVDWLLPKKFYHKLLPSKIWGKHYRTKKLIVKYWWNEIPEVTFMRNFLTHFPFTKNLLIQTLSTHKSSNKHFHTNKVHIKCRWNRHLCVNFGRVARSTLCWRTLGVGSVGARGVTPTAAGVQISIII